MTRNRWLLLLFIGLGLLPLLWYVASPLFIDQEVDEAFPVPTAAAASPETAATTVAESTVPTEASPMTEAMPTMEASSGPLRLASGTFGEIDAIHRGSGEGVLYELGAGEHLLRLEGFEVTNGPDLYVYLSAHPAPRSSEQLHEGGALEVARLKGNLGNQNYELPADFDPALYRSVVIYCKQFSVIFTTAELLSDF